MNQGAAGLSQPAATYRGSVLHPRQIAEDNNSIELCVDLCEKHAGEWLAQIVGRWLTDAQRKQFFEETGKRRRKL